MNLRHLSCNHLFVTYSTYEAVHCYVFEVYRLPVEKCDKLKAVESSRILAAFFYLSILNYQSAETMPNRMDGHISSSFVTVPA